MLRTTHSPPKYSSNPDLPSTQAENNKTMRSTRKRPYDGPDFSMQSFESRLDEQLIVWNKKIDQSISDAINLSMQTCLSNEFKKLNESLNTINSSILSLRLDNQDLKDSLSTTNTRVTEMERALDAIDSRQDSLDSELKKIKNQVSDTSNLPSYVQQLEKKIAAMEQQSRDCNVEIVNIPERRNENLVDLVMKLGSINKHELSKNDIIAIHRVPHAGQQDTRPKNVIVKFSTRVTRDNFLISSRAVKELNTELLGIPGTSHKVYVNEHLTLTNKRIFRECRARANQCGYKYVWVKHGTILARKSETSPVVAIRSENDFKKIK
ncbi:unnamed protein product [Euphydryas editha]|uniref:FP protein C-terminal domain-containing protein n=1 Tax=Euphydryas editha TaxID=104508 RepID=A0AAU9TV80_EUPED|nr:unnamed protein product [Euphydryas editha]